MIVPYAEAYAYRDVIGSVPVASLEHLLVLKSAAFKSRVGSERGDKDLRDIAKIVILLNSPRFEILSPYVEQVDFELLKCSLLNFSDFKSICVKHDVAKNMKERLRKNIISIDSGIKKALHDEDPDISESLPKRSLLRHKM